MKSMKNMKCLVIALAAMISTNSMAYLLQPAIPAKEDAPMRLTVGGQMDIAKRPDSMDKLKGFVVESLGGGLGFSHNVGYDFEYGIAAALGGKSTGKLFNKESTDQKLGGALVSWELMLRYMPQVMENFNLGGILGFGADHFFMDEKFKAESEKIKFGDMHIKIGLGTSYRFADMFAMYFAPTFKLGEIRIHSDKADETFKKGANVMGIELPIGASVNVMESMAIGLEYNAKMNNPFGHKDTAGKEGKFADSFKHGIGLNISYDL